MNRENIQTDLLSTFHALSRQARRNLSNDDIGFVVAHGQYIHCAGALHIFLGQRDIPLHKEVSRRFGRLEGTVLVIDVHGEQPTLLTVYRNRNGLKRIRAKHKYNLRSRRPSVGGAP